MINITNKKAKKNYAIEMTRQMMILENIHTRELKPVLNRQFINVAKMVRQDVVNGIEHIIARERGRLAVLFSNHYKRVATIFSKKV